MKNVHSVAFDGVLTKALMFYKIGSQDIALFMSWNDESGWHSPKPIDQHSMVAIASQTSGKSEYLPSNILTYTSDINYSWWVPAKRRKIKVKGSKRKVFNYPAMVFSVLCNTLRVGCLKQNRRPNLNTKVYSIFGPIDVHGLEVGFCQTRIPDGVGVGVIPLWEDAFFKSTYNHLPSLKAWKQTGDVRSLCIE